MEKNRPLKIALPTRSDRLLQHQTELPRGGWLLQRPLTPSSLVGLRQLLGLYEDSGPLVFLTMARLNPKKYDIWIAIKNIPGSSRYVKFLPFGRFFW